MQVERAPNGGKGEFLRKLDAFMDLRQLSL